MHFSKYNIQNCWIKAHKFEKQRVFFNKRKIGFVLRKEVRYSSFKKMHYLFSSLSGIMTHFIILNAKQILEHKNSIPRISEAPKYLSVVEWTSL